MGIKNLKRTQENLRRKKKTLFKKVYKFGRDYNIDVVLIIHYNSLSLNRLVDQDSWPPPMKQIVRQHYGSECITC
jgi:hypothetical protein